MREIKKLSLFEIISMAIGTMIGASIFSVFGIGAEIAGKNLPGAFVLSGVYALVVAYSYAILGRRIISNSGPIAFILRGLGDNTITGALSVLMWIAYLISISLFLSGFTGYLLPFIEVDSTSLNRGIAQTIIILGFIVLHLLGTKIVGRAELYLVIAKVAILFLFIGGGLLNIDWEMAKPDFGGEQSMGMINASIILFLSYMGFGLITNSSENIRNPKRNIPLAIFISILFVMILYLAISIVTVGNLAIEEIVKAKDNALAIAAKPFLGKLGFVLITLAALFSLSSSLNATIFGGANISYSLAKNGELPKFFERKLWFNSSEGFYITAGAGLLMALFFQIGSIASMTSTIFTVIYIFVVIAHLRLRKDYGGSKIILIINLLVLLTIFGALMNYQWNYDKPAFYASLIAFTATFLIDKSLREYKKRKIKANKAVLSQQELKKDRGWAENKKN